MNTNHFCQYYSDNDSENDTTDHGNETETKGNNETETPYQTNKTIGEGNTPNNEEIDQNQTDLYSESESIINTPDGITVE